MFVIVLIIQMESWRCEIVFLFVKFDDIIVFFLLAEKFVSNNEGGPCSFVSRTII